MSKQIQLRRGTAAQHSSFTGAVGEITVDTTNSTLRVHDGKTVGGVPLARQDMAPDYIIAWQAPTADNSYTWYRKYKSGWVEQGGIGTVQPGNTSVEISYPVQMRDANYTLVAISKSPVSTSVKTDHGCHYVEKHFNRARIISIAGDDGKWITTEVNWMISGICK